MFKGVMYALVFLATLGCFVAATYGLAVVAQPLPVVYSLGDIKAIMPRGILVEPGNREVKHGGQLPAIPSIVTDAEIYELGNIVELSTGLTDIYQVLVCTDGDGYPELALLLIQSDQEGYAILVGAVDISAEHEYEG